MRTERPVCVSDALPEAMVAKLRAIGDTERRLPLRESKTRPSPNTSAKSKTR
jgi:hypothetical protein